MVDHECELERQEVPSVLQIRGEQWGCQGGRTSRTGCCGHEESRVVSSLRTLEAGLM